jgi:hypothetical protein
VHIVDSVVRMNLSKKIITMVSNSASSLIIGNPKPGTGGEQQQPQHSASGGKPCST